MLACSHLILASDDVSRTAGFAREALVPDEPATTCFLLDRAYYQGGQGLRKDQALTAARRRWRERGDPAQV